MCAIGFRSLLMKETNVSTICNILNRIELYEYYTNILCIILKITFKKTAHINQYNFSLIHL